MAIESENDTSASLNPALINRTDRRLSNEVAFDGYLMRPSVKGPSPPVAPAVAPATAVTVTVTAGGYPGRVSHRPGPGGPGGPGGYPGAPSTGAGGSAISSNLQPHKRMDGTFPGID